MGGPGSGRKRGSGSTRSSTRDGETFMGMKVHKYKSTATAASASKQRKTARDKDMLQVKRNGQLKEIRFLGVNNISV
jgi:hypothetical protein